MIERRVKYSPSLGGTMKIFGFKSLKKAIFSIPFLISCLLVIGSMISAILLEDMSMSLLENSYEPINFFLTGYTGSKSTLAVIAPIVCTLPIATGYVVDYQSGFEKNIIVKMGMKKYYQSRFITSMIVGGLSILIPMMLFFVGSFFLFHDPMSQELFEDMIQNSPYKIAGVISPYLYVVIILLHCFVFGMVYAVLGFAVSFFIKKKYIVWIFPFFISIAFSLFAIYLNLTSIETMSVFDVTRNSNVSLQSIWCEFVIIFVGSYFIAKKKLEEDMRHDKEF